jgi:hypothetical protein
MEVYRFGEEVGTQCYTILIIEDNGEKRISTVGLSNVTEYIAHEHPTSEGYVRLRYGSGSSIPYIVPGGKMCEKWVKISG